jgi:formate dehydrogenase gamma subunit
MKTPEGRHALTRFTVHQRVQHWILAICFISLCLTGFPIKFSDRAWAGWVIRLLGGLPNARAIHRIAGVVLIVGFFYHFLYIFAYALKEKRRTGKSWLRVILDLPMVTNPQDIRQLFQQLGYLLFLKPTRPPLGRFSLKEKFEYFGVFWGSALLGVTGILMWANPWTTKYLTGRVLTVALLVHGFEAFLALLHVGVIHMIGVIFSPVVFPLSRAMFSGGTPVEELAEAHAGYVDEAAARLSDDVKGDGDYV